MWNKLWKWLVLEFMALQHLVLVEIKTKMHVACRRDTVIDVSVGFWPPCWCPSTWAPTWYLYTKRFKFGNVILCNIYIFLYSILECDQSYMYASLVNSNHIQLYDCCKSSANW